MKPNEHGTAIDENGLAWVTYKQHMKELNLVFYFSGVIGSVVGAAIASLLRAVLL